MAESESSAPLCPACAGQLAPGTETCPWCGAGTLAPDEETRVGGPPPSAAPKVATTPNIGFGEGASRPLPPIPPPPRSLPHSQLNPTQIFLRAVIVIALTFIAVTVGRAMLANARATACSNPETYNLPICR